MTEEPAMPDVKTYTVTLPQEVPVVRLQKPFCSDDQLIALVFPDGGVEYPEQLDSVSAHCILLRDWLAAWLERANGGEK